MTFTAVRKLPMYRWLIAGTTVITLLVGAAYLKTSHKQVLAPVAVTPIAQTFPQPAPTPAPKPDAKKHPAKAAPKKG